GEWKWILGRGKIVSHDADGKPLRMTGTTLDVTDRKSAQVALEESEEKYRNLFENAPIGIFQSTVDGTILSANPAYAQMFGYQSPEDVADSVKDVATEMYCVPKDRIQVVEMALQHDQPLSFENLYRRK